MKYIPILNEKKFKYIHINESKYGITLRNSPIADPIILNYTSYMIMQNIDGYNSLEDIVKKISNKFKNVDYNRIEHDVNNLITFLWNFRLIKWKDNNPFKELYTKNIGGTIATYMHDNINSISLDNQCYLSPYLNKEFDFNSVTLETLSLYGNYLFFEISSGIDVIANIGVQVIAGDRSLEIIYIKIETDSLEKISEISEDLLTWLYIWCMQHNKIPTDAYKGCIYFNCSNDDDNAQKYIKFLKFEYIGLLKDEVEDGDIQVYAKSIEFKSLDK